MEIPSTGLHDDVLKWVQMAVKEGQVFLESQYGYNDIEKAQAYVMGDQALGLKPQKLSNFASNQLGKITTDIVAGLTDIKPLFAYRTSNDAFEHQAAITNDLAKAWWLNNFADLKLGAAIQLAVPAGCAYLHLTWNPRLAGGDGDIDIQPVDCRDVLPIRPTSSISIQDSLGVIVRSIRTVNELETAFPHLKDRIIADEDVSFTKPPRRTGLGQMVAAIRSAAVDALMRTQTASRRFKIPGKEVYVVYVKDNSLHQGKTVRKVGFGSKGERYLWSYEVAPGAPLFPRGRMIVCSNDMIFYDGPNIWWFDKFPVVKLPMDLSFVYNNAFLSKSVIADIIPHQDVINEIINGIMDCVKKVLRPNVFADMRAVSQNELQRFDPRKAGQKVRLTPRGGRGIDYEEPPVLPPYLFDFLQFVIEETQRLSGTTDFKALLEAKQMPALESFEAIWQAMTPATRLRGRMMEYALRELADMLKMGFMEFYDTRRRISILGEDGLTFDDFDFDPGNYVPDGRGIIKMPDGQLKKLDDFAGKEKIERAQILGRSLNFYITPNSMLELALMSKRAQALLLRKSGDLDHDTLLEMLEFPKEKINQRLNSELNQKIAMVQQMTEGQVGRPATFQKSGNIETKGTGRPVLSTS